MEKYVGMLKVQAVIQTHYPTIAYICDVEPHGYNVTAAVGSADSVETKKPRVYKLYYSPRRDAYYFRKDGQRFYLNEAIRVC